MTKRIATAITVLAATLVLAAPVAVSSAAGSDGSSSIAKGRWGCC